jgi:CO/xanthine dehydrogenase Mo-binding subunit
VSSTGKIIGGHAARIDGPSKVSGRGIYSADIQRPGTLWAGFLHSACCHGRIVRLEVARARKLPGVKAVITGADVAPRLEGYGFRDKPVIAQDRVRYLGEKVAAVAASDRDVVEEALSLIDIEYEPLPAVFDPLEALQPDAPTLHPEYARYDGPNKANGLKNICSVQRGGKGDIDRGFAEADHVIANTFRTQMAHQGFLEPRCGVVDIDRQGRVQVWHCHQAPFKLRRLLSQHTGIPETRLLVHPVFTGGSFGAKLSYEDLICTYYLARAASRPVKYIASYAEELSDGEPRHASVVRLRTGVKKTGELCAWEGEIIHNGGAYGARTPRNGFNGTMLLAGSYRTPHVRMAGYIVYTNQVPCGYFRGPGEVQTLFAVESQMDMIAQALDMDPLEFRQINALREGDTKPSGEPLRFLHAKDVLQRATKVSRSRAKRRPRRSPRVAFGRGVSFGHRHIAPGESNAELHAENDGSLRLVTAVRDVGGGAHTMLSQVVAEILGVTRDVITVDAKGTDGPFDEGVRGAKGTHVEGQAVGRAAAALIDILRRHAGALWNVDLRKVRWSHGAVYLLGSRSKRLTLKELVKLSGDGSLKAVGHYDGKSPDIDSFQSLVAEVEVDKETGQVLVTQLCFTYDVGTIINPVIHQGQIDGAVIQGLGFSLSEQLAIEQGQITTMSLGEYKIPCIRDVPPLATSLIHGAQGYGPFGAKSVAECAISIIAPAIANAVYNATGVRIRELPISAEKVLAGLRSMALSNRMVAIEDRQPCHGDPSHRTSGKSGAVEGIA